MTVFVQLFQRRLTPCLAMEFLLCAARTSLALHSRALGPTAPCSERLSTIQVPGSPNPLSFTLLMHRMRALPDATRRPT